VSLIGCALRSPPVAQRVIVSFWDHGEQDEALYGVDLDGVNSSGRSDRCDDFPDDSRSDGTMGIDNAYASLVSLVRDDSTLGGRDPGIASAVAAQLENADALLGFEVERLEVDGDAPIVMVTLLAVEAAAPLSADIYERLLGAEAFTSRALERVRAEPVGFRWRARFTTVPIPMGTVLGTHVARDVIVEFELGSGGRLVRADLGGVVALDTIARVTALLLEYDDEAARELVRSLGVLDVEPDATGFECAAMSIGLGIELVPIAH
jgi:hypothetical protein